MKFIAHYFISFEAGVSLAVSHDILSWILNILRLNIHQIQSCRKKESGCEINLALKCKWVSLSGDPTESLKIATPEAGDMRHDDNTDTDNWHAGHAGPYNCDQPENMQHKNTL